MKNFSKLLLVLFTQILIFSCSHYDQVQGDIKESGSGEGSHNSGKNCGSCHNKNGTEAALEGWWTISGTAYYPNGALHPNATIQLWEKPNKQGKLIKSLVSDSKGNFYTNQIINFNNGCFINISSGINSNNMSQSFNGGSCNSCHGISTAKITVN